MCAVASGGCSLHVQEDGKVILDPGDIIAIENECGDDISIAVRLEMKGHYS